jgi:uncharacterized protein (TIGR02996 family)
MIKQTLETALLADPDDIATHSAYADHLMSEGDPRGEFIQAQLVLEDPTQAPAARNAARQREKKLLDKHVHQWLGEDMGRFLIGDWSGWDKPYHYQFARGWLDHMRVLPAPDALIAAIARSPEARLLRRLEIVYDMRYHPFEFDEFLEGPKDALSKGEKCNEMYEGANIMPPLLASKHLSSLRVFKLGYSDDEPIRHSTMVMPFEKCNAEHIIQLLEKCPRLEELYLNTDLPGIESLFAHSALSNIRILQYYFGSGYTGNHASSYPLTALAKNSKLQKLTALRLHPGRDATVDLNELNVLLRSANLPSLTQLQVHMTVEGDSLVEILIDSKILGRLKSLDLAYGNLTDDNVAHLAKCPDLKHVKVLDVSKNALSSSGINALKATGIQVVADDQHEVDGQDYLYEVDVE